MHWFYNISILTAMRPFSPSLSDASGRWPLPKRRFWYYKRGRSKGNKIKLQNMKENFSPWLKPQQSNSAYLDPQSPQTDLQIQSSQAWYPIILKN